MRTPGRCTNFEGCWIGATQRDVWLSIGEDFACPNCGGALTAPSRRSISTHGLKKAVTTGVAISMGIAAVAVVGVKISAIRWVAQPSIVAQRHLGAATLASRAIEPRGVTTGAGTPAIAAGGAPLQTASAARAVSIPADRDDSEDRPAPTFVNPAPAQSLASLTHGKPESSSTGSVLVFSGDTDKASPGRRATADMDADAGPQLTASVKLVAQAAFVMPAAPLRHLVLPISFGKPVSPEDDQPPVSIRWRAHGLARVRDSYFLAAPTDADPLEKISRTPSFLR